jgi:hypothetical protein
MPPMRDPQSEKKQRAHAPAPPLPEKVKDKEPLFSASASAGRSVFDRLGGPGQGPSLAAPAPAPASAAVPGPFSFAATATAKPPAAPLPAPATTASAAASRSSRVFDFGEAPVVSGTKVAPCSRQFVFSDAPLADAAGAQGMLCAPCWVLGRLNVCDPRTSSSLPQTLPRRRRRCLCRARACLHSGMRAGCEWNGEGQSLLMVTPVLSTCRAAKTDEPSQTTRYGSGSGLPAVARLGPANNRRPLPGSLFAPLDKPAATPAAMGTASEGCGATNDTIVSVRVLPGPWCALDIGGHEAVTAPPCPCAGASQARLPRRAPQPLHLAGMLSGRTVSRDPRMLKPCANVLAGLARAGLRASARRRRPRQRRVYCSLFLGVGLPRMDGVWCPHSALSPRSANSSNKPADPTSFKGYVVFPATRCARPAATRTEVGGACCTQVLIRGRCTAAQQPVRQACSNNIPLYVCADVEP